MDRDRRVPKPVKPWQRGRWAGPALALLVACRPAPAAETPAAHESSGAAAGSEALPSWNDGPSKRAIMSFVERVTDPNSPDFVPAQDRVATFDNDGTLWSEQPAYFQLLFAVDRIRSMEAQNPQWRTEQPFKAALEGDWDAIAASGKEGLVELVMASHAGMDTETFEEIVEGWIETARHPQRGVPYTDLVYAPMLEVIAYLQAHDFEVFIVSGGGIEFIRAWAPAVYGIPSHNVIGSTLEVTYEVRDGVPVLMRQPKLDFVDDKAAKPVAIHRFIGKRPIAAFGNSDGDFQMLEWTTTGDGARLGVLIHHTDAEREWAYDRESSVGRLSRGLDEAHRQGWTVVDMEADWSAVHRGVSTDASTATVRSTP